MDAINSQLFCMNIDEIGRRYRGSITFWGEIDRQHILPSKNPDDVREAVRKIMEGLDSQSPVCHTLCSKNHVFIIMILLRI